MITKWFLDKIWKKDSFEYKEWRTENSILKFLNNNVDENGKLSENAGDLPDEIIHNEKIRFAPGLMDAMLGSEESDDSKKKNIELTKHLKGVALHGNKESGQKFYRIITENEGVVGIIDEFLRSIINESLPIEPHLINYARDLIAKSEKRNAVKFGIAILGLCQNKSSLNEIMILGMHDEFTVYATIAIANISDNVEHDLWELAKKVDGWGKIQLVDRLSQRKLNESIKDWLIYDGYVNNIMNEYLAYTCAINGELHSKLKADEINRKLFKSASDIIEALLSVGGPAEDITTYPFASQVILDFIRHAKKQAADISDYSILNKISEYLEELEKDIGEQRKNGWNEENILGCLTEISELINGRDWKTAAIDGLQSNDNALYWNAKQAAQKFGIDLWETVWLKLQEKPLDSSSWYDITHYSDPMHSSEIIDFALKHLPLDEMATGPSDGTGFGENYNKFTSLDFIITYLEDYPRLAGC